MCSVPEGRLGEFFRPGAAVHHQGLAGRQFAEVAGEEQNRADDISRLQGLSNCLLRQSHFDDFVALVAKDLAGCGGIDDVWCYRIYPYVEASDLTRQTTGQSDDS